jgi:hypothetical protein
MEVITKRFSPIYRCNRSTFVILLLIVNFSVTFKVTYLQKLNNIMRKVVYLNRSKLNHELIIQ